MRQVQTQAEQAYGILCGGGVVLLPTDVGYGLVAVGDAAVERIYALKGRPRGKACITVGNAEILKDVAVLADERMRGWIGRISQRSPIAVVNRMSIRSRLLGRVSPLVREQATTAGTIATFLNAGELVSRIAELAYIDERIVVGSSANLAFTGNNYALEDVPDSIRDGVDLVIDGGRARYSNPDRLATTLLDLTTGKFLRKGIDYDAIAASWRNFRTSTLRPAC